MKKYIQEKLKFYREDYEKMQDIKRYSPNLLPNNYYRAQAFIVAYEDMLRKIEEDTPHDLKVGDNILVMDYLKTTLTKCDYANNKYYFTDPNEQGGKEYHESRNAIELIKI